jgi:DNA primase large subunit
MKKEPEPLIELLYQEFPNTDPIEIERITKRVRQWLEQKHKYFEKMSRQVAKKLGEDGTGTYVSKTYPSCIEELLRELSPQDCPVNT